MAALVDFLLQIVEGLFNTETQKTWLWWLVITLAGIFNIYWLIRLLRYPSSRSVTQSPHERAYRKWMKVVVSFWVIACALRSLFPVDYGNRRCFFSFQSPALNRGFAFVAEVTLPVGVSAACKFFLNSLKKWLFFSQRQADMVLVERLKIATEVIHMKRSISFIFYFIDKFLDFSIFLIFSANICCNLGTISKNDWWYFIEESCWAIYCLGGSLIIIFLAFLLRTAVPPAEEDTISLPAHRDLLNLKRHLLVTFFVLMGGLIIILFSDLPKVRTDALKDCNRIFCNEMFDFDFLAGFQDARTCYTLDKNWELWKFPASWQTPYFTLSVWAVLWFASCPGTVIFQTKVAS
jgi:hypothetical protein